MVKSIKIVALLVMFVLSIMVMFEQHQEYITLETYNQGLDAIDEDFRDTGLLTPPIERYLSRHFKVDDQYIRVSYNWKQGLFYMLGTVTLSSFVMEQEKK